MERAINRDELHLLIDQLPPDQIVATLRFVRDLQEDPVLQSLLNATADDEPYTDDERQQDAEGIASIAEGRGISHDDILSEFGLSEHGSR